MELSFGSAGVVRPNRRSTAGSLQPRVWQMLVLSEAKGRALGLVLPAFAAVSFFPFVGVFFYCGGHLSVLV